MGSRHDGRQQLVAWLPVALRVHAVWRGVAQALACVAGCVLINDDAEGEVAVDSPASEGPVLAEFHMYDHGYVTIGDPPWEEIPLAEPATWPPALNRPAWRWWRAALPVTL